MRSHYQPSGLFDPVRLVVAIAALFPLAGLLGWMMSGALAENTYAVVFIPFLAALPLAAAGRVLARWSHVRNPPLAFLVGAALATLMYVGQHYATMVALLGPRALFRFDIFPGFLVDLVNHHLVIGDHSPKYPGKPDPWLNWSVFGVELALCAFISGWQWYRAARRPYCEECRC